MKSIAERQNFIMEQLSERGFVTVQELADQLGVTAPTIRKDLRVLESKNLLIRTHGSATTVKPFLNNQSVTNRATRRIEEKNLIAKEALKMIANEDAIMLGAGSTCMALAKLLPDNQPIRVLTTSLPIAITLNEKEETQVMILGGKVNKKTFSVKGNYAEEGLQNVNCSKLYIGCDGIDIKTGITCGSIEGAKLTNAMMRAASKTIVLADSSKFGQKGFGKICQLEDIDVIITDAGVSEGMKSQIEHAGIEVIIAK